MDKMNKSVLTPNMFGRHKSRRANDTFVSSNPYVKFKKDNELVSNPSATLRNQSKPSNKKHQQSKGNNSKLHGEDRGGEHGPDSHQQQSLSGSGKAQHEADGK